MSPVGTTTDLPALAERVVEHEWAQFQRVRNEGGRAECQDDWPTFRQMRLAQLLTWPRPLVESYADDLTAADACGRNLLTEKYARMMASTEPERYQREIAPWLPALSPERIAAHEDVVAAQVAWAREFRDSYPRLGRAMRVLRTSEDTLTDTSFETYLRGELGSYSERTLARYVDMVDGVRAAGGNLTTATIRWTVLLGGYGDLDEAERDQHD